MLKLTINGILLLATLVNFGCTSTQKSYVHKNIPLSVQNDIGADFYTDLYNTFLPSRLNISVEGESPAETALAQHAQAGGFGISQTTGHKITISIFRLESDGTLVAVMNVGKLSRFTKRYQYTNSGLQQIGSTSVGS